MSKIKYCVPKQKRDPVKGLILEYQAIKGLADGKMAEIWGVSRTTCSMRLHKQHSDLWLTEAKELCKKLEVPIEELRAALRY